MIMPTLKETFPNVLCTAFVILYNAVRAYVDSLTLYRCHKKKKKKGVDEVR